MQNQSPLKRPFFKTWIFWAIFIYLLIIFFYTVNFYLSDGENKPLPSNEFGDFLAGVFAPLAFFFILLGYKQQSVEIQNNTQERLEQKRQSLLLSQPFFHFKSFSGFIINSDDSFFFNLSLSLSNSRAICRQLFLLLSFEDSLVGQIPAGDTSFGFINNNFEDQRDFYLITESTHLNFENEYAVVYLLINYTDLNDLTQMQSIKLLFKNDKDGSYSFSHYIVDKNSYQH
ncbi:hypothetical protein Q5X55_02950 [Acinetobacter baumannii]|nr:hypothetical protein [Acinetobacter baumannii]